MAQIYTLREEMHGDDIVLNGLLLKKKVDHYNKVMFFDACTNKPILRTTPVVNKRLLQDGIIYTTVTGDVYDLMEVDKLIPTKHCSIKQDDVIIK